MRVNSVFTSFFAHLSMVRGGIVIVMLFCFSGTFAGLEAETPPRLTETSPGWDRDMRAKQVNLIIRQIGHRLLLQAGDSTSRVMPVTETKQGTFLLRFENEFVFDHDSLIVLSQSLLPKIQFPSGYTVTVLDCMNADIIFGFQVNTILPDNFACRGRSSPRGCYTIEFTFPDFYLNEVQKESGISKLKERKTLNTDLKQAKTKPEVLTAILDTEAARLTEERKLHQEKDPKPEEFKATTFGYSLVGLVYSGMLISLGVTLVITRFGKIVTPGSSQTLERSGVKEFVPEFAALGKFLFDVKSQRLFLGSEVISLTDKECKVLQLLNEKFGELIPRETLMQEVWIKEGVITGRSLDMFVSKLRKKLSADSDLRITNVHGKGYKLEELGDQGAG